MKAKKKDIVSAQVIMKAASGQSSAKETITAETLSKFAPAAEAVGRAQAFFAERGFTTEPLVGISFAISAPVSVFESLFAVELVTSEEQGIQAAYADGSTRYELPVELLPSSLAVDAVTFTPPPAFGPTSF